MSPPAAVGAGSGCPHATTINDASAVKKPFVAFDI
jgi:hypothetical protein